MVPSLELSIVVSFEEFGDVISKRGPSFNTIFNIFYKKIKILVLSYNLPHFAPVFEVIDKKIKEFFISV